MLITSMLRSHALVDFIVLSFVLLCAQGAYVSVLAGGGGCSFKIRPTHRSIDDKFI